MYIYSLEVMQPKPDSRPAQLSSDPSWCERPKCFQSPLFALFVFSMRLTARLPLSPLSIPRFLSCPGSRNTLFPPSDCMSCWPALPFHAAVCVCVC